MSSKPVVLVIGGTSGLGLALARQQAEDGWEVHVASRRAEGELFGLGDEWVAAAHQLDLTRPGCDAVFLPEGRLGQLVPRIHRIIYAPGARMMGPLSQVKMDDVRRQFDLAVGGLIRVVKFLDWRLTTHPSSEPVQLVVVSSTTAFRIREGEMTYAAVKAAQSHLTRCAARELMRAHPCAQIMLVQPGGMRTAFWDGASVDTGGFMDPTEVASIILAHLTQVQEGQIVPFVELTIPRPRDGGPIKPLLEVQRPH